MGVKFISGMKSHMMVQEQNEWLKSIVTGMTGNREDW